MCLKSDFLNQGVWGRNAVLEEQVPLENVYSCARQTQILCERHFGYKTLCHLLVTQVNLSTHVAQSQGSIFWLFFQRS